MSIFSDIIGGVVQPFSSMYSKRQERLQNKESLKAKIQMGRQEGINKLELSDKEWEVLKASKEDSTWKDEYSLIVATAPIPLIILGVFWMAFTGDVSILSATTEALGVIKTQLGIDMGLLAEVGIFSGLGIKGWKTVVK